MIVKLHIGSCQVKSLAHNPRKRGGEGNDVSKEFSEEGTCANNLELNHTGVFVPFEFKILNMYTISITTIDIQILEKP